MASILKPKRRTADATAPTTADLADGEVAINHVSKTIYQRIGAAVVAVANFFTDAPSDGTTYGRKDGAWVAAGGGGGGGITVETQDSNYTFVAADSGKCKASSVNGTRTYTIPNSTFSAGDILYVSFMGSVSTGYYTQIMAGSGFALYRAGTKTESSAYVYGGGLATIFFTSSSAAIYSGPGVA